MKVFTTGQVAKICKVAPRTVSKWFDSGRLKGYRIPGSQDRRIPKEYLEKFLREHGMENLASGIQSKAYIALFKVRGEVGVQFRNQTQQDIQCEEFDSTFDLGIAAREHQLHVVILDLRSQDSLLLAKGLNSAEFANGRGQMKIFALADNEAARASVAPYVDEVFLSPFDPKLLQVRAERFCQDVIN